MHISTCDRCGAVYDVEVGASRLHCSSCNHTRRLDTEVIRAAAAYQNSTRRKALMADKHALVTHRYSELSSNWQILWFLPFMVLLPLCMFAASSAPGSEQSGTAGLIMFLLVAASIVGFTGNFYFGRSNRANRYDLATLRVGGTRCRYCGASTQFEVGVMVARCHFCHASLLASSDTIIRGTAEAACAARMAKLSVLQSERQWSIRSARKLRIVGAIARFSAIAVFLVAGVSFSAGSSSDSRESALVSWMFCGLVALGIGGHWWWKRTHIWHAAKIADKLIDRFGGRALKGVPALAEWLDVFWSDDFPMNRLSTAAECPAVACAVRGYPALVIINPIHKHGSLEVLLSVWYEGCSEFGKGPQRKRTSDGRPQLLAQGFELHTGPSGIRASMTRIRTKAFYQWLDLEESLVSLATMSRSQGGQPQEPLSL
jgi:hypothetical protein